MGKWLLVLLVTHGVAPRTSVVFVGPEVRTLPAAVASFEHLPEGSVRGALLPDGALVVAADRAPGEFGATLLRVEPGREAVALCDRLVHASRPLVAGGRVFVERGRDDELTLEEIDPQSGRARVIWRGRGLTAHLAGALGRELFVYHVREDGAALFAVDFESGRTRAVIPALLPYARDFSLEGGALVFENRDESRSDLWVIDRVELATGARRRLLTSPVQALAPRVVAGDVAYNEGGLRLLRGGALLHRPGDDVARAATLDGRVVAVQHYSPGASLPELEIVEGRAVRTLAAPAASHFDVVGFK
jgi:hypothetical protein